MSSWAIYLSGTILLTFLNKPDSTLVVLAHVIDMQAVKPSLQAPHVKKVQKEHCVCCCHHAQQVHDCKSCNWAVRFDTLGQCCQSIFPWLWQWRTCGAWESICCIWGWWGHKNMYNSDLYPEWSHPTWCFRSQEVPWVKTSILLSTGNPGNGVFHQGFL